MNYYAEKAQSMRKSPKPSKKNKSKSRDESSSPRPRVQYKSKEDGTEGENRKREFQPNREFKPRSESNRPSNNNYKSRTKDGTASKPWVKSRSRDESSDSDRSKPWEKSTSRETSSDRDRSKPWVKSTSRSTSSDRDGSKPWTKSKPREVSSDGERSKPWIKSKSREESSDGERSNREYRPQSEFQPRNRSNGNARPSRPDRSSNKKQGGNRGGRKASTLDPRMLIKQSSQEEEAKYESKRLISELPISPRLKESLAKKGFTKPTEIQDKTIESLLEGRDLLGIAQTGTGKTGAFLIPIINQLMESKQNPYALVVVPTRELALQVEEEFRSMTKDLKLFSTCFIGGTNINKDVQNLRRSSHVIIGTPGRLLDLVQRKVLDLRVINTLVLDEFDRMLDMGFVNDVQRIIRGMHQRQHTMLFSATLDDTQKHLIAEILTDPVTVKVSNGTSSGDFIEQDIIRLEGGQDKFDVLHKMLAQDEFQKVLVFEETKHLVKRLRERISKTGILADEIHGNKSQNARQKALTSFKQGNVKVLVATDVAARGIDVSNVTHVINYQLPQTYDSYIHRIGRTGRAGKRGKAFTFVD